MNKKGTIVSIITIIFFIINIPLNSQTTDSIQYSFYHIKADKIDLNSVNSFPQKIITILNVTPYEIKIQSSPTNLPAQRFDSIKKHRYNKDICYPEHIAIYLEPTELIEYKSPKINCIVDSLSRDVIYTYNLIDTFLHFVSSSIKYDHDLAKKITRGEHFTRSALQTLESKMGTCSEYTNLFLALIRNAGIPGKFVIGRIILPEGQQIYHAWAECYIKDVGWMPVEVQNGNTWIPDWGIKLFSGKDFNDCNIILPEIQAEIVKVDE
jgi:transglutaminase/protease-like cytokinesis protein 3